MLDLISTDIIRQYRLNRAEDIEIVADVIRAVNRYVPAGSAGSPVDLANRPIAGAMIEWPLMRQKISLIRALAAAVEFSARGRADQNFDRKLADVIGVVSAREYFKRLRHQVIEPTMAVNALDKYFLDFPLHTYSPHPAKGFATWLPEYIAAQDAQLQDELIAMKSGPTLLMPMVDPPGPSVLVELSAICCSGKATLFIADRDSGASRLKRLRLLMSLIGVDPQSMHTRAGHLHLHLTDGRHLLASGLAYLTRTKDNYLTLIPIRGERLWCAYQFALGVGKTPAEASTFSQWRILPEPNIERYIRPLDVSVVYILQKSATEEYKKERLHNEHNEYSKNLWLTLRTNTVSPPGLPAGLSACSDVESDRVVRQLMASTNLRFLDIYRLYLPESTNYEVLADIVLGRRRPFGL